MSVFTRPLALTDDGKKHEPVAPGRLLEPDLLPVSKAAGNVITKDSEGLLFAIKTLLSDSEKMLSVQDSKLRSNLALRLNSATNMLELLGAGNVRIAEVKLPVVPGLPIVAEVKKNFKPPTLEYGELPVGTYMHLQFQMSDGTLKDIYYNVSDFIDVYTGGNGISVTNNVIALKPVAGKGLEASATGASVRTTDLLRRGEKILGVADNGFYTQLSFAISGDTLILRGQNNAEVARIALPVSGETLTSAEFLREYTPPPPHGANQPVLPRSDYLHLHFDSAGNERDLYIDMGAFGGIWGKRVTTLPTGEALDKLLEDMPVGAFVWSADTDGLIIYLTPEEADIRYVALTGNQTVQGTKTFATSPTAPTPTAGDNSTRLATTAFVTGAIAASHVNDATLVRTTGTQSITGAKNFTVSPTVPTAAVKDNSTKAASTAFVMQALAAYDDLKHIWGKRVTTLPTGTELDKLLADMPVGAYVWSADTDGLTVAITQAEADKRYVALTGNQSVAGIKTFSVSPLAPTPAASDNSTKVATTAFVTRALASVDVTHPAWGKRVTTLPTGDALDTLLADMPVGAYVWSADTDGLTVAITQAEADARYVALAGNQTVQGTKTFSASPVLPTPAANDNSTKAATTAFVMRALASVDVAHPAWGKRVTTLPTGAELDALLSDMPVGAYVWSADTDNLSVGLTASDIGAGLKLDANGKLTLDIDPSSPLQLTADGKLTLDQSGLVSGGVSTDTDNALVAGADGKPYFPGNWGTL